MNSSSANKNYFELEYYSSEYQTFYVDSTGADPTIFIEILVREEQGAYWRCGVKIMNFSPKI